MGILEKIVQSKKKSLDLRKRGFPQNYLEQSLLFSRPCYSLVDSVKNSTNGIIAEFKRRSPSKGEINYCSEIVDTLTGYEKAGVSGISVLTDVSFFGGSVEDLTIARGCTKIPILRKDFIFDPYQIIESKAFGSDLVLLIARILKPQEVKELTLVAHSIGLEVLLEIHDESEFHSHVFSEIDLIGINNRNLNSFRVDPALSISLSNKIPDRFTKIAESGIRSANEIRKLKSYGYDGFLIGEQFMKANNPAEIAHQLIQELE